MLVYNFVRGGGGSLVGGGGGRCWALCEVVKRRPGASPWVWAAGGSEGGCGWVVVKPFQRAVQSIEEQGDSSCQGEFQVTTVRWLALA